MRRLLAAAALAAALLPAAADAQSRGGRERAEQSESRGPQVPLPKVLQMIASSNRGRHLNTEEGRADGRPVYFVKWQYPDGRVVVFVVDAESGQMIGRQGG